jgi:DNA polymerase III epsilon subunit-like protein
MDDLWLWTEADPAVKSRSLDSFRELLGLSKANAHDALQDVKDTANIFIRMQKSRRVIYQNMVFKDTFADGKLHIQ